jgi:hypothetical protein
MFDDDDENDVDGKKKHTWAKLTNILTKITSSLEAYHFKMKSELDDSIKAGSGKA